MPKVSRIKIDVSQVTELVSRYFSITKDRRSDFIFEINSFLSDAKGWIKSCEIIKNSNKTIVSITPFKSVCKSLTEKSRYFQEIEPISELILSSSSSSSSSFNHTEIDSVKHSSYNEVNNKFDHTALCSSTPLNTLKIRNNNSIKNSISIIQEVDTDSCINEKTELVNIVKLNSKNNDNLNSIHECQTGSMTKKRSLQKFQNEDFIVKNISKSISEVDSEDVSIKKSMSQKRPRIIIPQSVKKIKNEYGTVKVIISNGVYNKIQPDQSSKEIIKNFNGFGESFKQVNKNNDARAKVKLMMQQKVQLKKTLEEKKKAEVEERRKLGEKVRQEKINNKLVEEKNRLQFLERKAKFEEQERQKKLLENRKMQLSAQKSIRSDNQLNTSCLKINSKNTIPMIQTNSGKNVIAPSENSCIVQKIKNDILIMNTLPLPTLIMTDMSKSPNEENYSIEDTFVNYGISDLASNDESENEDSPKKPIPIWAQFTELKKAIKKNNIALADKIFGKMEMPMLFDIFPNKKLRYFKRTSSACWSPCTNIKFK